MVQRAADIGGRSLRVKASLANQGYAEWPHRVGAEGLAELEALFGRLQGDRPGLRIDPNLGADLLSYRAIAADVGRLIGPACRPVRAVLFDKHDGANWALGWHQDRTIEVAERRDVSGFGSWTIKQGRLHVAPPIAVLRSMLTIRIHLDAVPADNAPLLVAPGSHRLGLIAEPDIEAVVARCGVASCLAQPGTIWVYATPILHASARSSSGHRRRVLQMDIAATDLPGGLKWAADA